MEVKIVNDGPVTVQLESPVAKLESKDSSNPNV